MKKKLFVFVIVLLVFFTVLVFWQYKIGPHIQTSSDGRSVSVLESNLEIRKYKERMYKKIPQTITIGAIGDILIHDRVYRDARTETGYDFTPMFRDVKELLSEPDIVLANQESILGGTEIGLSSYPTFNSPQEVGDALLDAGIDIVSTANNHTLDRGEIAILQAIRYYEQVGLPYVGHFKDFADQKRIRIIERNGIKVAFLAYTYGTNGIPVPKGKEYLVNLIDKEQIHTDVTRAKQIADCIVLSIHWGTEYERYPNDEQKNLANELAHMGVDIIFGHHPHVLQPMEWIETEAGRTFVVYSLGNFLAGQTYPDPGKDYGGLVTIDITKGEDEQSFRIELKNPQFMPTYIASKNEQDYRVIPLTNATFLPDAEKKYQEIMEHMTQWLQ